jgi:hypothetical protein
MLDMFMLAPPPAMIQEWQPPNPKQAIRIVLRDLPDRSERECAMELAWRESRFDIRAANESSTAVGIWQLIWGKRSWTIEKQFGEANKYATARYGSWCAGQAHHDANNWW